MIHPAHIHGKEMDRCSVMRQQRERRHMIEQELYATMPATHHHHHQQQHFSSKKAESKRDEVMPLLSTKEQSFKSKTRLLTSLPTNAAIAQHD